MEIKENTLLVEGKKITYTHIHTGSQRVCFMFSGSSYSYDKPLFYYSTMLMLQHKIDVVHIHYTYPSDFLAKFSTDCVGKTMMKDLAPVVTEVLTTHAYTDYIFLAKSLGTIPLVKGIMMDNMYNNSTVILLTPLLSYKPIFKAIKASKHKGLVVIGDKDQHFSFNKLEELEETNLKIEVIKGANHSLEIEEFETMASIKQLEVLMKSIEKVLFCKEG